MSRLFFPLTLCAIVFLGVHSLKAQAVNSGDELQRFAGSWKIVELVDDGRSISLDQIQYYIPSSGSIEVVDNTMLFTSKLDGSKQAKVFSIDPTVYPKAIAVSTRDKAEGWGIYRFEGERLIVCLSNPATAPRPTDFSSRPGSSRMMMVLEPDQVNRPTAGTIAFSASAPPRLPDPPARTEFPTEPLNPNPRWTEPAPANPAPAAPASTPSPVIVNVNTETPQLVETPPPAPASPAVTTVARSVSSPAAAVVLSDSEMRQMIVGAWQLRDSVGVLQMNLQPDGTFQTYREMENASTFHAVFYPTPVSSGTWRVANGQLILLVTASTLAERVNHSFANTVRSVSATDAILVDFMGQVVQAKRVQ